MILPIRMTSAILLLTMTLSGCTHWVRDDSALLGPIPEREQVEINASGMRVVGVGVRVDSQQVSYVKYFQDPACDSCRATIPRTAIDSVRVSAVSAPRTLLLLATIAAVIFLVPWPANDAAVTY
jgi:hypothetical protein